MAGQLRHGSVGAALSQAEWEATDAHVVDYSTFNPTVTQSTVLATTVGYADYTQMGKFVHVCVQLTINSAGSTNTLTLNLTTTPPLPRYGGGVRPVGTAIYYQNGTANFGLIADAASTGGSIQFRTSTGGDYFGLAPAIAAASSDALAVNLMYETT